MDTIRIWRSPYSPFGTRVRVENEQSSETYIAEQVYTDEELAGIAAAGFNGIWVHTLLHQVVFSPVLPELGLHSEMHLSALRKLIYRAGRHGIKVYLYMQPPRALPTDHAFWKDHPDDVGGHIESAQLGDTCADFIDFRCFCTSKPKVKQYLRDASERLAAALPDIGGIIMITASEYSSHCVAHSGMTLDAKGEIVERKTSCPLCKERQPADIISEIITLMRDGIRAVSDDMQIWAWNWSWSFYYKIPCTEVIEKLPKDVTLMLGFERGGFQDYCGQKNAVVNEYSISYAGPSEQCKEGFEVAQKLGLKTSTKLQFATTHELATVVNLPLLGNLFKKADYIRKNNIIGYMGCWNFGNMLSANTAGFNYFLSPDCPDGEQDALQTFATDYLPGCNPAGVMNAWYTFADAMLNYPFGIPYLYVGPTNYSLAYVPRPEPLNKIPAGRAWLDDERGDELKDCLTDFTLDEVLAGFEKLSAVWQKGVEQLEQALAGSTDEHAVAELTNARICGACFHSTLNTFKFYKMRLDWSADKLAAYRAVAEDELAVLEAIKPVVASDKRQGYHSEAHAYMFNEEMIANKIEALKQQLT